MLELDKGTGGHRSGNIHSNGEALVRMLIEPAQEQRTLIEVQQRLVAACMHRYGYEYKVTIPSLGVLLGRGGRMLTVEVPGVGIMKTSTRGCITEAHRRLYGDFTQWKTVSAAIRTRADVTPNGKPA